MVYFFVVGFCNNWKICKLQENLTMKTTVILLFLLTYGFFNSQNIAKVATYSMDNPKKSYQILASFSEEKSLNELLINVDSEDVIYDKSTLILNPDQLVNFSDFLIFLLKKKKEWDPISLSNQTNEVVKNVEYEKDVKGDLVYRDGPVLTDTKLYGTYVFIKKNSAIIVNIIGSHEVKDSSIIFPSTASLESFIKKIDKIKIQQSIDSEFTKVNLLK